MPVSAGVFKSDCLRMNKGTKITMLTYLADAEHVENPTVLQNIQHYVPREVLEVRSHARSSKTDGLYGPGIVCSSRNEFDVLIILIFER